MQVLLEAIEGMTFEEFEKDMKTIHAVQHQLLVLGEATKIIENEFRKKNPDIPWKEMAGTRDVLIHSYEEADLILAWDISLFRDDLGIVPEGLQEVVKSALRDFLDL